MPATGFFSHRPIRIFTGTLAGLLVLAVTAHAQILSAPPAKDAPPPARPGKPILTPRPPSNPAPPATVSPAAAQDQQATIDRLNQSNRDLLDLLKKQQGVLEDISSDRRLLQHQVQRLMDRLQTSLETNNDLQAKIAKLEAQPPPAPASSPGTPSSTQSTTDQTPPAPPAPPASYLPAAPPENGVPEGTLSWHRLFTLSGTDPKNTELFHIQGRSWRIVWHNQDRDGDAYKNTSALFINAFPKDDTIPQKVCAKLGSGGDSTELQGPGNFSLKVEASGGKWELAVEDFY